MKKWAITGELFGESIDDTVLTGNYLSVIGGVRSETTLGNGIGRQFVPTTIGYSEFIADDLTTSFTIGLTWPYANRTETDWQGGPPELGGSTFEGAMILAPVIRGLITWSVYSSEETISSGSILIAPEALADGDPPVAREVVDTPITLCGYTLRGYLTPGQVGTISGSIAIKAAEFWGPEEWAA